tara:strand:+ start:501 stop:791 length:291 start_codon:yes stop_codon:yes gene_type:complete
MAETETKTKYVGGIRFFPTPENAPENLCANGVLTPSELGVSLKQEGIEDAKGEYKGNVQYKITLWKRDDGSYNLVFNTFKPEQKGGDAKGGDDLPF